MRTLAIECTSEACSVALFEGEALLAGDWRLFGRGHAEALVPMIAALPDRGKAARLVVGLGPGSFTGVRIGLAAARALALAWDSAIAGYPTLALVAAMAQALRGDQPVTVAMSGGHGEWFMQNFDGGGLPSGALAARVPEVAATRAEALVAGSQAEALVARRADAGKDRGEALMIWPDARAVMALPTTLLSADLSPFYGRAPDATPIAGGRR